MTLEEKMASTRAGLSAIKLLTGDEKFAAAKTLMAEIAADRAISPAQLSELARPARPKLVDAQAALRELVWQLYLDAGLEADLVEWLEDIAAMEGLPRPVSRPMFTDENVVMASELLVALRIGDHPWLRNSDEQNMESPVWEKGFECPPGVVIQQMGAPLRTRLIGATGIGRGMWPARSRLFPFTDPQLQSWILPAEVDAYFADHNF
ncbi:hypothetical protein [Arthrobacter sp. PAMC 25486]|uniref:hypothetical protein n=1 Tax=Arthrobacter sp. PAMC 25486 TaxID=1494608 RepID=UPI00056FD9C5|nr:hypothetical protein [Arthrobacter sp. PAMC 25486]